MFVLGNLHSLFRNGFIFSYIRANNSTFIWCYSEKYSEPCQISKIELFAKIVTNSISHNIKFHFEVLARATNLMVKLFFHSRVTNLKLKKKIHFELLTES